MNVFQKGAGDTFNKYIIFSSCEMRNTIECLIYGFFFMYINSFYVSYSWARCVSDHTHIHVGNNSPGKQAE